jgi:hypothetical protein
MKPAAPRFEGFQPAQVDFDASRIGLITPFRKLDIDLGVAPGVTTSQYTIEGDFVFVDLDPVNSNGNATIEFNRQQDADNGPIYLVPGLALTGTFKGFKLNWAVQAGKKMRLIYSTGSRINPASASIATIGAITAAVGVQGPRVQSSGPVLADLPVLTREIGFFYGASFASQAALASGANEQIFAAASNPNGCILWDCDISTSAVAVGTTTISLHAHTGAPAAIGDGNIMHMVGITMSTAVGINTVNGQMIRPRFIGAGKGLWFLNSSGVAEGVGKRRALYTLF